MLTEHAMAWNRRKILNLADSLAKRYLKVLFFLLFSRFSAIEGNLDRRDSCLTFTWQTTALCFLWCFCHFPRLEDHVLSIFLSSIVFFVKVKDDIERHSRELVDLASDLDVDVSTSNMQSWASEVREHAKSISFFPCNLSDILLSVLSLPISS